jgi:acyl-CoA reductase-like NAD-dependent aldehyde dehydrogenase
MLIGGEWTQAALGETFETVNPATGSVLVAVASGGPADVDSAVAAPAAPSRIRPGGT